MSGAWQDVETMPMGRTVLVKTASGLERLARRTNSSWLHNRAGVKRLHCWRADGHSGDLSAVAWKERE